MKIKLSINCQQILAAVRSCDQDPATALRFFKTAPGTYGAHDQFLGISTSNLRTIAARFPNLTQSELTQLLASPYNEIRALALFGLVNQYQRAAQPTRETLCQFYLAQTKQINNWNLVDISAHLILGNHLQHRNRSLLLKLAASTSLWERRIAIVATLWFIKHQDLDWTFKLAAVLENDSEDLIHKAVGWMLRETGKQDLQQLLDYLQNHAATMPRTSLRYAIERLPAEQRKQFLAIKRSVVK